MTKGTIAKAVAAATARARRVRRYRQVHGCRAPSEVTVNLSVSFSVAR
jgi:hypothetical protein